MNHLLDSKRGDVTNPLFELERTIAHLRLTPRPEDERMEELKQQYETVLTLLESEFLGALISGDWTEFDQFINEFRDTNQHS